MTDEKTWLSRKEAAKRAGVGETTIRQIWEPSGKLETRKLPLGRKGHYEVQIEVASLDRMIAERQTPGRLSDSDTRERLAASEAENRELRSRLAQSEGERRELLDKLDKASSENRKLLERVLRLAERD